MFKCRKANLMRVTRVINNNCEHKVVEINLCQRTNTRIDKIANSAKSNSGIANIKTVYNYDLFKTKD